MCAAMAQTLPLEEEVDFDSDDDSSPGSSPTAALQTASAGSPRASPVPAAEAGQGAEAKLQQEAKPEAAATEAKPPQQQKGGKQWKKKAKEAKAALKAADAADKKLKKASGPDVAGVRDEALRHFKLAHESLRATLEDPGVDGKVVRRPAEEPAASATTHTQPLCLPDPALGVQPDEVVSSARRRACLDLGEQSPLTPLGAGRQAANFADRMRAVESRMYTLEAEQSGSPTSSTGSASPTSARKGSRSPTLRSSLRSSSKDLPPQVIGVADAPVLYDVKQGRTKMQLQVGNMSVQVFKANKPVENLLFQNLESW